MPLYRFTLFCFWQSIAAKQQGILTIYVLLLLSCKTELVSKSVKLYILYYPNFVKKKKGIEKYPYNSFKGLQNPVLHSKIVSEYDQEIPHSQTADNPMAPRGRAAQPSRDTRKTNKAKQPALSSPSR